MSVMPVIEFRDVHKSFGTHQVLKGVSVDVTPGTVHFIMGKSGAGKSVLTRQVIGLLRPDSGQVLVDGQDVSNFDEKAFMPVREKCQMIFQHATLFESMTVLENIAMPLRKRFALKEPAAKLKAEHALSQVHIVEGLERMPAQLGAGVKKRVAIARAIINQPALLLADEPTGALDSRTTDDVLNLFDALHDQGITLVLVTHEDDVAARAERVAHFRDGRVERWDGRAHESKPT